jgi:hypothetical protein
MQNDVDRQDTPLSSSLVAWVEVLHALPFHRAVKVPTAMQSCWETQETPFTPLSRSGNPGMFWI